MASNITKYSIKQEFNFNYNYDTTGMVTICA